MIFYASFVSKHALTHTYTVRQQPVNVLGTYADDSVTN